MYQLARCAALAAALRPPTQASATVLAAQPCLSLLSGWATRDDRATSCPAYVSPRWPSTLHAVERGAKRHIHGKPSGPLPDSNSFFTPANTVSLARALSGPIVAHLIITEAWPAAICLLAVSGASDWLDGHLARKYGQQSVLGTYLDPLADKVLIGCVVGALLYKGMFPAWLAMLILGRDAMLVGVATARRFKQVGWRWPGASVFFQLGQYDKRGVSSAPPVQPLMVSKVNTVLQLALVAGCIGHPVLGWPPPDVVTALTWATAGTTTVSWLLYAQQFINAR